MPGSAASAKSDPPSKRAIEPVQVAGKTLTRRPNHLLLDSGTSADIPSMVPETPEQVNVARAKNHGITCLIFLARVNELFENTFVNRRKR